MSERRAVRRDAHVAQDREIESAGVGDPVNGRDHRQREPVYRVMEPVRRLPDPLDMARVGQGEFPQVEACAEAAAAPGDDQGLQGRIVGEPAEDSDSFLAQCDRQRVLLSGRLSVRTAMPSSSGPLTSTSGEPATGSVTVTCLPRRVDKALRATQIATDGACLPPRVV